MRYQDLFQSGQIDLENAEKQYEEHEYMLSAFLAQQALEKHVKAYLLKNDIFENVKKLGHLPLSLVIRNILEQYKTASKKSQGVFIENFMKLFEVLLDFLVRLEKKEDFKIIVWKSSLGIPLTTEESNIEQGITTQFNQISSKLEGDMPIIAEQFQNMINLEQLNKIDISKLDKKTRILVDFLKKVHGGLTNKFPFSLDDVEQLLQGVGYGSGKNSFSEKETNYIQEIVRTNKSLKWMDEIIDSFPHQTLSRYPFEINGKTNYDLYIEYKDNLQKLINKIKNTCEDIRKTN